MKKTHNVSEVTLNEAKDSFEESSIKTILTDLDSKYKLEKYLAGNFQIPASEEIKVGREVLGKYTSPITTIKFLFEDPTFQPTIEQSYGDNIKYI